MLLGICQTKIVYENKAENIEKAVAFIKKAAKKGADIILFPEMSFTGFSMNIALTGEKDGYTIKKMQDLAENYNIAIGFGHVALVNGKGENKYTVVDERGEIISDYAKIHPFSCGDEDKYFTGGDKISLFSYKSFGISTFICYDLRFPEIFQSASQKADIITVAANWPAERADHWKTLLKARAIENMCYIAGINCTGKAGNTEYSGGSCVYSPDGRLLCDMGSSEDIAFVHIDNNASEYRSAFPVKKDRRTELYKKLL